jgi:hypothetical protein
MTAAITPTAAGLATLSRTELDHIFRSSPPGPIPVGRSRGTAIIIPGSWINRMLSVMVRTLFWKGKIFDPQSGDLRNLVGPFGTPAIRALVYEGKSWFANGPAIILDYSRTSFVARPIRDEIRQVAPSVYLGQVFWGKRRIALFMLEFPAAA